MRAVNLIPADYRKPSGIGSVRGPAYVVVGLLTVALGMVTLYVVTSNSVSTQKAKLESLQQQLPEVQALANKLSAYTQFASLAQQRAQTVTQIASTRFDWAASMADLARVIPANTTLQSLVATTGTSSASGAPGAPSGSGLRGALPDPAFELRGCTGSQDDVARLMSRLRLMDGVVRVSLNTAAKQGAGGATPSGGSSGTTAGGSCPGNESSFDVIVFFQGPPSLPAGGQSAATPATSTTSTTSSTTPATSSTAPTTSSTTSTTSSASGSQP